ncbi:hypothetical protein [Shewanella algae]|uniref:hypothetical protein n=1 Tax=Shewanella algae TaxID=38313 RepID=UPI001AACF362|nr:hypothetical protein [Shewanella algae]MBO2658125.1 hypothetical protein [Shewanella algae]
MAKTVALITIHGMGDTERNYYAGLYDEIEKSLGKPVWDKVIFKDLYYQDILQGNQEAIFNRMRDQIDWMKLRKFLLFGFSDAASLEVKKNDARSPYFLTQKMILDSLDAVFEEAGNTEVPIIVIAQSLGCQVISNYIWDADPSRHATNGVWSASLNDGVETGSVKDNFRRMRTLHRLYTTGCNIPIFVAGHKKIEAITPPNPAFKWHNFFDEDDVLGWPLKPLSPSYNELVEDLSINAGGGGIGGVFKSWNPFSHGQYWTDGEVIRHLSSAIKLYV